MRGSASPIATTCCNGARAGAPADLPDLVRRLIFVEGVLVHPRHARPLRALLPGRNCGVLAVLDVATVA